MVKGRCPVVDTIGMTKIVDITLGPGSEFRGKGEKIGVGEKILRAKRAER